MNDWILTKDKLPIRDDYYLTISDYGRYNIFHWSKGWNCFNNDKKHEITGVVAWMELPEPPQGVNRWKI